MEQWLQLTESANQLYRAKQYDLAELNYVQALELSKRYLEYWIEPSNAITALTISYLNLSSCWVKKKEPKKAAETLIEVIYKLRDLKKYIEPLSDCYRSYRRGNFEAKVCLKNVLNQHPNLCLCRECYEDLFNEVNDLKESSVLH